jgi:hypothetical protein
MSMFHLYGCTGQLRLLSSDFDDPSNISDKVKNLFKEISILNMNSNAADMLIIKDYYH